MGSGAHYLGHRKRLRQRFLKGGLETLHDYEALELLLTLAIPRRDVKPIAKEAIKRFGSFRAVLDAPLEELRQISGIGETAAVAIKLVRELALLYLKPQTAADLSLRQPRPEEITLDTPQRLFDYCRAAFGSKPNEEFVVIYLNTRFRILDMETLVVGTIDRAVVHPRRVMEEALKRNAAYLVLVHNHPGGDVTPSEADKTITRALVLAGKTLDITVYDHVIVSQEKIFSFREAGLV